MTVNHKDVIVRSRKSKDIARNFCVIFIGRRTTGIWSQPRTLWHLFIFPYKMNNNVYFVHSHKSMLLTGYTIQVERGVTSRRLRFGVWTSTWLHLATHKLSICDEKKMHSPQTCATTVLVFSISTCLCRLTREASKLCSLDTLRTGNGGPIFRVKKLLWKRKKNSFLCVVWNQRARCSFYTLYWLYSLSYQKYSRCPLLSLRASSKSLPICRLSSAVLLIQFSYLLRIVAPSSELSKTPFFLCTPMCCMLCRVDWTCVMTSSV